MKLKTLVALALCVALVGSCGLFPKSIAFTFYDRPPDSRSTRTDSLTSQPLPDLTPDESLEALVDFYQNAGTLVGKYTPTKFKLFISNIVIFNQSNAVNLSMFPTKATAFDPVQCYADFVESVELQPATTIPADDYTGLLFFFGTSNGVLGTNVSEGSDYFVRQEPIIEVTIPGYGDVWPSVEDPGPFNNAYTGDPALFANLHSVVNLEGDSYRFEPDFLQPGSWTEIQARYLPGGQRFQPINYFAYMKDSPYRAILPGTSGIGVWSTADPTALGLIGYNSTGNYAAIIMPFDGIVVPSYALRVGFSMYWDLTDIIEVYDAGTSEDKSDDVIVLASDFWERFSLIPTVQ